MELQLILPNESSTMDPDRIAALAVAAEEAGYGTAWLPDHLLPPQPYGSTYGGVYEPLVTIGYLAARTGRIRLGTSVLVLPMRNPFVVAKQVATLDRIAHGRVTLGIGIGWDAAEFANVGADFHTRGKRTDEAIALLRRLFAGDRSFHGRFHGFDDGFFEPRPHGEIPIMVGGSSAAALRRAVASADEWQGIGGDPEEFAARVRLLRDLPGRTPRVGTRIDWPGGRGELPRVLARARALADAGAETLAVRFGAGPDAEERAAALAEALR